MIKERFDGKGKNQFVDFYGKKGTYEPAMGSNMKGEICPDCAKNIDKLSVGGGKVYYCPNCHKL
jgi:formamidopyrimidine-DNA glycosylase